MLQKANCSFQVFVLSPAYLNNLDESSPDYKDAQGKDKSKIPHELYYIVQHLDYF